MIFTARLFEAQEALAIGLVSEVVAEPAALMARAQELARLVAGHAPLTLQATKQALRRLTQAASADVDGDDLVTLCYTSADFREGMEAFLGKRTPNWQGK
jgi:enoyl-CoA hydratase